MSLRQLLRCSGIALAVACTRFKTTDEIREGLRAGDSTGATGGGQFQPCEVPSFDDFGWRADSIGPLQLRVHPAVRAIPSPEYGRREYRYRSGALSVLLAPDAGNLYRSQLYRNLLVQAPRWPEVVCEIAGRTADVAVPLQKNLYATAIRWSEAVGDESLVAVVSARTLEDYRVLRALLFTIRFPTDR